jgi:hypothetical protein
MLRFRPWKGGHAPGHLRGLLDLAIEDWPHALMGEEAHIWRDGKRADWWNGLAVDQRARWITGQLWNCTDTLDSGACEDLGLPHGSTYAQAVRSLRSRT